MSDTASTYARLKAETAAMLGLNPAELSKTEGLRLDITSLLLLEIDSLQGSILANEQIDLARLSSALTMLQKLLPSEALNAPVPLANGNHDFSGAKEELDRFLIQRASALEAREVKESERLAAENAKLREDIAQLQAQLKTAPQQQPEKQPASTNVVPIDAKERMRIEAQAAKERTAKESAQNERDFRGYYGGGALIAPGVNIDPRK